MKILFCFVFFRWNKYSIIYLSFRVDVNKNESTNSQERMIVIHGQQENCIQACREILRIMYEDAKNKNKPK